MSTASLSPAELIARWKPVVQTERATAQSHFLDICRMLGKPGPVEADPSGESYAFEKGTVMIDGKPGWADVWMRGHFAWEYKRPGKQLSDAYNKLLQYAAALENPPLLVTSDIQRIVIRTNWTNTVRATYEFRLDELAQPKVQRVLRDLFEDPEALRPDKTRQELTSEVASEFAALVRALIRAGHSKQTAAHFVNRLVFCLFADDAGLLPEGVLRDLLEQARRTPERFQAMCAELFAAMANKGGSIGFKPIPWFNGNLFEDATALQLTPGQIQRLRDAHAQDWSEIDVSILGTLFEAGLEEVDRAKLGAHYTDREKIMRIIEPVILRPLLADWAVVLAGMSATMEGRGKTDVKRAKAQAAFEAFRDRLTAFRVLDPACGSGNFLYVALQVLLDVEQRAILETEALLGERALPRLGPEVVRGLELEPYAAELAQVSVWIGYLQWLREKGYPTPSDPVLKTLDAITCGNALVQEDGTRAEWPEADVVVGNPPFLGDKLMRNRLGDSETERIRAAFARTIPGGSDLVCYWFEQAREAIAAGQLRRAGLVATQSIRKGKNRVTLDRIVADNGIFDAWADEPWVLKGAAVRVSMICFGQTPSSTVCLDGAPVAAIAPDLTAGEGEHLHAAALQENARVCFQGPVAVGAFDPPARQARAWLEEPLNAFGRANAEVLRPWVGASGLLRRTTEDVWIIDFASMGEEEAKTFAGPYSYLAQHVRPTRLKNRDRQRRERWWQLGRTGAAMRAALAPLPRYIVTPETAQHRIFTWMHARCLPEHKLYAIARDDDTSFGILHSRFHELWALRMSSRHGAGNDPRYTNTRCFETFPFPEGLTPELPAASYADNPNAQAIATAARDLHEKREAWLNPPDLIRREPEVVPGYPDRIVLRYPKEARRLRARTLTRLYNMRGTPEGAWLDALHARLDATVAAAYGWPADISEEEALAELLALNRARSAAV